MNNKPTVVLALARSIYSEMFRSQDLARLGKSASIVGPLDQPGISSLAAMLSDATIAITGWGTPQFDRKLLEHAPKLKLIAHSAGTVKLVVSDAVFERGIRVTTAAAVNAVPVAQYTVAMMVSLLKQIPWLSVHYSRGENNAVAARLPYVRELMDLNIGIVGASRIGREVIRLLHGYPRLAIKLYDPYITEPDAKVLGVQLSSLEEVCKCDVVSLHAPSIPETRHMLNARTIELLPDHAVLLNTARGALVDDRALVSRMQRRPLYVCLDTTDPEPPEINSPLRTTENIILTPHIAGAKKQARLRMGRMAIEEAMNFIQGNPLSDEVTPAMFATQA